MSAKAQVYILASILIVLGLGLIGYKTTNLEIPLAPGETRDTWVVEALIEFDAAGGPVQAKMALPGYHSNFKVLNQYGASPGYGFSEEIDGRRKNVIWSTRNAEGPQKIYYMFSMYDTGEIASLDGKAKAIEKPFFADSYRTAVKDVVEASWAKSANVQTFTKELVRRFKAEVPTQNIMLLKRLIKPNYPLEDLIRDLILTKEISAATIKGLKIEEGKRKSRVGAYLAIYDKEWMMLNLETEQFGIPADVVFWGPFPLLETEGAENSKISFSMSKSTESAKGLAVRSNLNEGDPLLSFSIYSLPIEHQNIFKLLLLVPFGCLIVVIVRNLIGLPTSGTFMPVLLAMAFIETTLVKGLVVLGVVLALGLIIRTYLSRLNLLLVPRISAVVISVVILMAAISVLSYKLGLEEGVSVTLFPMIIISWTIERISILWEEHGGLDVSRQMGGSLFVSIIIYFVMTNGFIKYFTFAFPECLLVLLGLVLLVGVYSGYRLTELARFEPLVEGQQ